MRITIIFSLLLFCRFVVAQTDSSKAVIYFKQKDAIIYLDGQKITSKQQLVKISVGPHKIKAWAPKHDMFIDSFIVKKNENKFYSKKLVHTDSYKSYRNKKRLYVLSYVVPAGLSIISAGTFYVRDKGFDKRIHQANDDAMGFRDLYNTSFSPEEFESNYNEYYQKNEDYKKLQSEQIKSKNQGIIITSALATTAVTFFIINKCRKKTSYQETPLLARIIPSFNPINKQLCLIIKLD